MDTSSTITIHLIPNAHLDPVWLWDWREGFTEMVTTTRLLLDLMEEFQDLTFVRGEAFFYRYIEQSDPKAFRRLQQMVAAGRWDVVGGTLLQADTNLPVTETLARHLLYAQRYFLDRFGLRARAGWSADCFGHSAHLPDLLASAGIEFYAYTRPAGVPPASTFWWEGPAGARLLVHHPTLGWYGTERDEILPRLDGLLQQGREIDPAAGRFRNVPCFIGLGDHGGHPTRRMLAETSAWSAAHPETRVEYSGLTRYFDALREEIRQYPPEVVPVFRGEINFAPRGVYSANARFKFAYRRAEAAVSRAECISSLVAAGLSCAAAGFQGKAENPADPGSLPPSLFPGAGPVNLREAWEALLFNTFHDILPGSSIERAYTEQHDWLGIACHTARLADLQALLALGGRVDTTVSPPAADLPAGVPFLVVNPHPWPYHGPLELEACLDYRPIWKYRHCPDDVPLSLRGAHGELLPLQKIAAENLYAPSLNIRTRVVAPVSLPAMGWAVLEYAYEEGAAQVPPAEPVFASDYAIRNRYWEIQAETDEEGVRLLRGGQPVLDGGLLRLVTIEDPWGLWGDFNDSPESRSLVTVRQAWRVSRVEVGETGPLRATLLVRLVAGCSRLDLAFALFSGRDVIDVRARLFWDERCARLNLALPGGYTLADYDVLGGQVFRGPAGDVPGGRWVKLHGPRGDFGFASDALYGFNLAPDGVFHATIARATRYAADAPAAPDDHFWLPVLDAGELSFCFLLTADLDALPRLAAELEQPPLALPATPSPGDWSRSGSLLSLSPEAARLLALKPAEDGRGWILRIHSQSLAPLQPTLTWLGQTFDLPPLAPLELATFRLLPANPDAWQVYKTDLLELA